ncbi:MAG TPA: thioredoxin family protein, partial [Candidatus Eisenbacteria bacterium]
PRAQIVITGEDATMTGSLPAVAGPFTRTGSDITFSAAGGAWKLAPEAPLVGEISQPNLLLRKKDYQAAARAYKPKNAAISLIKSVRQPIQITVFFGTWCSYCKHYLPGFMKTIDAAANPAITVTYIGISEDMSEPEAELTKNAVTKTPTFIVSSGGQEIGRIVEKPKDTIEEDLALLLLGGK